MKLIVIYVFRNLIKVNSINCKADKQIKMSAYSIRETRDLSFANPSTSHSRRETPSKSDSFNSENRLVSRNNENVKVVIRIRPPMAREMHEDESFLSSV